jgi:hypothetical protein
MTTAASIQTDDLAGKRGRRPDRDRGQRADHL